MSRSLEKDALKNRLQRMDNYDFEHFVADLWEKQGWDTEVEQQSGDAGVDVRATKTTPYPQKQLIQAKRYKSSTTVGGPDIQQYASLRHQEEGVDAAVIVTTSSFTRSAKERARDLNVKLVDGDKLVSMVNDLDAQHVADKYSDTTSTSMASTEGEVTLSQSTANAGGGDTKELNLPLFTVEYSKGGLIDSLDFTKTKSYYVILVGIIGWILALLFGALGIDSLGTLAMLVAWPAVPIGITVDSLLVSDLSIANKGWWFAVLGSTVPLFGVIPTMYYLIHRQKAVRRN